MFDVILISINGKNFFSVRDADERNLHNRTIVDSFDTVEEAERKADELQKTEEKGSLV